LDVTTVKCFVNSNFLRVRRGNHFELVENPDFHEGRNETVRPTENAFHLSARTRIVKRQTFQNGFVLLENVRNAFAVAVRHVLACFWSNQPNSKIQNLLKEIPNFRLQKEN
jgi:hypothetical protein